MSQIEEFIQSHECDGFEFAEKLRLAFVHDYSYDRIRNLRLEEY